MNDLIRRPAEQFSPKSSPRGSRSPVVPRQDSTGTLKTTISLGKTPAIINTGPFYLMKGETPCQSSLTGATNLFLHEKYNLEDSYNKFCCRRKLKDQLSAFLPNLPGSIDSPAPGDSSSLRSLIEKPPICGKELLHLTPNQLTGFRLHPGPLPEQYRFMATAVKAKKHKRQKREKDVAPAHEGQSVVESNLEPGSSQAHEKKHGKKRKHDDDREKERKKKKKEKKRKKMKHSPDSAAAAAVAADRSS